MMGSGSFYDQKAFEFAGTIGNTYKATVYCHGADDSGSDSKPYYTSPVTARRSSINTLIFASSINAPTFK